MLARLFSGAVLGVDAYLVGVEVDSFRGLPQFATVGLAEGAVRESRVRVKSAIINSDFEYPTRKITVNLAPAGIRKAGAAFDLPIAVGILAANATLETHRLSDYLLVGELSLSGELKPVRGALPIAVAARDAGLTGVILPEDNGAEAAVVSGIEVRTARHLVEAVHFLGGASELPLARLGSTSAAPSADAPDLADVRGQESAKRAIEVAAAGGHNLLLMGPPGSGKTMLAKRLPGVLPPMSFEESLEATKIFSVAGLLDSKQGLVTRRAFRSPHHTISNAGLVGGGSIPRPGEISLAHHGVLFLDELPEFKKYVLELLRQPLEDGVVTIARAQVTLSYPAECMLVAAMNPCPCGYLGHPRHGCTCTPNQVQHYRSRISGPLLDRIDLHVDVPAVAYAELADERAGEASSAVRARVQAARMVQSERLAGTGLYRNAQMSSRLVRAHCRLEPAASQLLETVVDRLGMSARAYDRILKVARTIADLRGADMLSSEFVGEAIQYRTLDRKVG